MPKLTFSSTACHTWEMQVPMYDPDETLPWPNGGIILQDVRHDDYNLAKDIRVARIWVFGDDGVQEIAESFNLYWRNDRVPNPDAEFDLIDFRLSSDDKKIKATENQGHPDPVFRRYAPIGYIMARYQVIHKPDSYFFKPGDSTLFIEQRVLLCDYGRNPAHEPGGVLDAARFFPMVSFSTENHKVLRIRVDYHLHFSLDLFITAKAHPAATSQKVSYFRPISTQEAVMAILNRRLNESEMLRIKDRPNQAGVFRDDEQFAALTGLVEQIRGDLPDDLFFAAEKPLQFELCAYGLIDGLPGRIFLEEKRIHAKESNTGESHIAKLSGLVPSTWDNVHFWGGFSWPGGGKALPSTPGAFHALHLHWRWGKVSGYPDFVEKFAGKRAGAVYFGEDQFKGFRGIVENVADVGGGLVDPAISIQTIRLAIVLPSSISEMQLGELPFFANLESQSPFAQSVDRPENIKEGENIVLLFSTEAHAAMPKHSFFGTFFIHGCYFGHNVEPNDISPARETFGKPIIQYGGGRYQYTELSELQRRWIRNADGTFR